MRFRRHQEAAQAATLRLALLFAVVVVLLVLAVNAVLALAYRLSFPVLHGYPNLFFETNTALVLLFVLGGCAVETLRLREGGAHVARLAGARPAQPSGHTPAERLERRFANIVQEMALASRMRPPAAWVLPRDDAINAFAAGWQAEDAVVAVTRGALERLTREELQGVVAHEFSHLAHGDTRLNMRLVGLVWGLQMVFGLGERLAMRDELGRRGPAALFGFGLMAVGSLGWAAGRLLQAAVSRQREFLADASAVQYTRNVHGLGGALRKIAQQAAEHADRVRSPHGASIAHLWLHARAFSWWASHPPLAERLRRLYGRPVEPLPAEPLPVPPQDEPLVALVPGPAGAAPPPAPPAALQHDPVQRAAVLHDAERETLERIGRWHGAVQLRLALLALLAHGGPATAKQRWEGWAAGLHFAADTQAPLSALQPAGRWQAMELLAGRMATAARDEQALLLRQAGVLRNESPLLRLRYLALRRRLKAAGRAPVWHVGRSLEQMPAEALAATRGLALAMPLQGTDALRWQQVTADALGLPGRSFAGPVPWRSALRLRRLSSIDRPRVVRAWLQSLPDPGDEAALEALRLACWILDSPLPPALGGDRSVA